jgi:hypothetical protein
MITLWEALQASSWQLIIAIGRQRGLGLDANLSKSELMTKVTPALLDPVNLNQALIRLPAQTERALLYLCQAGGHCPARYLRQQHGPLRPMSQLVQRRQRVTAQRDLTPFASLEQLCLLGLAFLDRKTDDLFIPTDLSPLIEEALNRGGEDAGKRGDEDTRTRRDGEATRSGRGREQKLVSSSHRLIASSVDLLCHDLTCLLALLQREDIAPLHERWLPFRFLADWSQHCAVPPASPNARSELQTGRRRFLHYLAENAGWLGDQGSEVRGQKSANHDQQSAVPEPTKWPAEAKAPYGQGGFALGGPTGRLRTRRSFLKPAPAAWLWLQANRDERLQRLWQNWVTPQPELWRVYRLPGHDWLADPARLLAPLHEALTELDPADPSRFGQMLLARSPALLDLVPANLVNPAEALVEAIEQLLIGPLVWLSVLSKDEEIHPSSFRLTLQGQAWLTGQPLADDLPPYAKFSLKTDFQSDVLDSTLTLTLEDDLPEPIDLMVAIEVSEEAIPQGYDETRGDEEAKRQKPEKMRASGMDEHASRIMPHVSHLTPHVSRVITAASFIKALHRGWSPPALLDALNRLANRPLTPQEITLLHAWAELADRVTIHHATLLETTDPDIIIRLASTRRGRALIHRTLSPRAIVVDSIRLDQLVRRLTEQEGVPPKDETGTLRVKAESIQPSSLSLHPSSAAHLWLAVRVYQQLGQYIPLPVRLPQTLLDQVTALSSSADLAAAEIAAEQTLAALQQVVEGRTIFPAWPEDGLPVEDSLPVIEEALATGQNLELLYYTAGTDRLTRRVVEPYRIEWRGSRAEEPKIEDSGWKIEDNNPKSAEGTQSEIQNLKSKIQNRKSGIPYLVGFCHRAQAERVFRLDRIQAITLAPQPDEAGQMWGE